MNPHDIANEIEKELRSQTRRSRQVDETRCPGFGKMLDEYKFTSDPYLESITYYDQDNKTTLQQLQQESTSNGESVLEAETALLFASVFDQPGHPEKISLYRHQAEAIRRTREGKHLVICTGTGSGKTESFLIPLLDAIIRERKKEGGAYRPGVRALILYPMNALVNDQLRRIRSILRHAKGIDGAEKITFGRYTGELNEKAPLNVVNSAFKENIQHLGNTDFSGSKAYPYLAEEETVENEITSRKEWRNNPGDILITNYSMLEQLMLDPDKSNIFCRDEKQPTWKFVVVDEAHYYNGSLGTDIAWLIRRVSYRCKAADQLQYIATSATLVDESKPNSSGLSTEDYIRQKFASKLFPISSAEEISVLLGTPYVAPPVENDLLNDAGYRALMESNEGVSKLYGQIEETIHGEDMQVVVSGRPEMPWKEVLLSELTRESGLLDITHWYLDSERWLRQWNNFSVPNTEAPLMTIGEIAHLARVVAELVPELGLEFVREQTAQAIHQLIVDNGNEDERTEVMTDISGEPSESRVEEILNYVTRWQEDDRHHAISAGRFGYLVEFVQELCRRMPKVKEEIPLVATWLLKWDQASIDGLERLKRQAEKVQSLLMMVKQGLDELWYRRLHGQGYAPMQSIPDFKEVLSQYYEERVHLKRMHEVLDAGIRADNASQRTHCNVRDAVFPPNEINDESVREKEFAAFVQMLSLTIHPVLRGKPLMDIRYHQLVHDIHSVSVYLKKSGRDTEAVFIPECEDLTCKDDARETHQLYTMGVCYACGEPYLLGYAENLTEEGGEKYRFSRYANPNPRKGIQKYYALSWLESKDGENEQAAAEYKWWFDLKKSILLKKPAADDLSDEQHIIRIYSVEEADKDTARLEKCPVCGESSRESVSTDGIIAPFKTGSARARTTILRTMIRMADADFACGAHKARGRKLLAFSDSRSAAAALAINYARFEEERLLERALAECLRSDSEITPELLEQLNVEARNERFTNATYRAKQMNLRNYFAEENAEELEEKLKEAGQKGDIGAMKELITLLQHAQIAQEQRNNGGSCLKNSLLPLMFRLHEKIREQSAESIALKEYTTVNENRRERHTFSKYAGYSLATLSALRNRSSKGLIRCGGLQVSSYLHISEGAKSQAWKNIVNNFVSPEKAEEFLQLVITDMFLRGNLNAEHYDEKAGRYYVDDIEKSLCGFDGFSRKRIIQHYRQGMAEEERRRCMAFTSINGTGKYERQLRSGSYLATGVQPEDVLNHLWDYLTQGVEWDPETHEEQRRGIQLICDESLNLDDLRFTTLPNADCFLETMGEHDGCGFYRIEEHSAQVSAAQGRMHQELFASGRVNILSCSTTFEMGVDLGNLNCVFLNNIAPAPANYCQRAGRAGRRPGSVSYVLTYIGESPHDQYYRAAPHKLFFGAVVPPRIYLDNESFRAKHLRAEALYHFLSNKARRLAWKKSGAFFMGLRTEYNKAKKRWTAVECSCVLNEMKNWAAAPDMSAELCKRCQEIMALGTGRPPELESLPYDVAADLYFQICGYDKGVPGCAQFPGNIELIQKLSGPNLHRGQEDTWAAPACARYKQKVGAVEPLITNTQRRNLDEMTTTVLSTYRVLPRYGFPCDVVALHPDPMERCTVDMSRPAGTGIFEYAPGQSVVANKRSYTSKRPIFYAYPQGVPEKIDVGQGLQGAERIYRCSNCQTYFIEYQRECPSCGGDDTHIRSFFALAPDGFEAERSSKAVGFSFNGKQRRQCLYSGGVTGSYICNLDEANLRIDESKTRSILYLNDTRWNRVKKYKLDYALMHSLRTDIVLWSPACYGPHAPFYDNRERQRHAWESALQAVLHAAAQKLQIKEDDLDGIVSTIAIDNQPMRPAMVLFDCSSSGSGAVLPLMVGSDSENENVLQLSMQILRDALKICECPNCAALQEDEAKLEPALHEKVLAQGEAPTYRDYRSCYCCLRSYTNQRLHPTLDVYEAKAVLEYLINPCGEVDSPKEPENEKVDLEQARANRRCKQLLDRVRNDDETGSRVMVKGVGNNEWVRIVGYCKGETDEIEVEFEVDGRKAEIPISDIIQKED